MILPCDQCGRPYRVEDNRPDACAYHPGDVHDCDRAFSSGIGAQGDFWECCGRQITSDDPFDVPGCATGPHAPPQPGAPRRQLLGQERREIRAVGASFAEQHISEFLRGRDDLGDGERWRSLFTAVGTLGIAAPAALIGILSSPDFPADRRRRLLPLVRDFGARAVIGSALGEAPAAPLEPGVEQEWRLDRLFTTFSSLLPDDCRGVASTPLAPIKGHGSDEDPRGHVEQTVAAYVTVVPSRDFVIRLNLDQVSEEWRVRAGQEAARGLLKAAVRLVRPPALACEITASVEPRAPEVSERAFHVAAYRAFQEASHGSRYNERDRLVKWTFASPFPDVDPPTDEESLEHAFDRIAFAFLHAGFDIDCSQGELSRSGNFDLMRMFKTFLMVEGGPGEFHFFFVCPYPWTQQAIAAFEALWHKLSYDLGHDGYAAEKHLIVRYPYPEPNTSGNADWPIAAAAAAQVDEPLDSPVVSPGSAPGLGEEAPGPPPARADGVSPGRVGHLRRSLGRVITACGVAPYRPDQPLSTRVTYPFRLLLVIAFLLLGPAVLWMVANDLMADRAALSYRGRSATVTRRESPALFWLFTLITGGVGLGLSLLSLGILYGAFTETEDKE